MQQKTYAQEQLENSGNTGKTLGKQKKHSEFRGNAGKTVENIEITGA